MKLCRHFQLAACTVCLRVFLIFKRLAQKARELEEWNRGIAAGKALAEGIRKGLAKRGFVERED